MTLIDSIQSIGLSVTTAYFLYAIAVLLIINKIAKGEKKHKTFVVSLLVFSIVFFAYQAQMTGNGNQQQATEQNMTQWQVNYQTMATAQLQGYEEKVQNTPYYDFDNPAIAEVAEHIALASTDEHDAIQGALSYVISNVRYDSDEDNAGNNACFSATAPSILARGTGQCDTQSIVVIALLRKMGIAAKPVGGCIAKDTESCALQSIFQFKEPKHTERKNETGPIYSRGAFRPYGLHAFVTAWTTDNGWIVLESTSGTIANTKCYKYHVELFPEDTDKESICVSKNEAYKNACDMFDVEAMNANGIGLIPGVYPQ
jgi:transglutaminase-like putative cysteine protease